MLLWTPRLTNAATGIRVGQGRQSTIFTHNKNGREGLQILRWSHPNVTSARLDLGPSQTTDGEGHGAVVACSFLLSARWRAEREERFEELRLPLEEDLRSTLR